VVTKIDKLDHADRSNMKALGVSTVTGVGIDDLLALIAGRLNKGRRQIGPSDPCAACRDAGEGPCVRSVAGLEQHADAGRGSIGASQTRL
jgi:hypothetical protein